jgi:small subunit ribosomal protein S4e
MFIHLKLQSLTGYCFIYAQSCFSVEQAPKPSSGPHKARECLPLILILRNRLKYALTYREVISILMQRQVMVDGKVRTDKTYPSGFMGKLRARY